jgi:hypothetical protein
LREPGAEPPRVSRRAIALLSIYAAVALGFGLLHALHVIR